MDDWKAPATCGCGELATTGLRTCARCRVVRLAAAHAPGERCDHLTQAEAVTAEHVLGDLASARLRLRALCAASAGAPTVDRPVHGENAVTRTFAEVRRA